MIQSASISAKDLPLERASRPRRAAGANSWWRRGFASAAVGAVVLVSAACAHTPPVPVPAAPIRFADSPAFAEVRQQVYALLERDLDADGLDDACTVQQVASGWAVAFFHHQRDEKGDRWEAICRSAPLPGPELDQVRWIEFEDGPLLLVSSIDENPDEVLQHVLLIDPVDGCATRLQERLLLVRPEAAEMISPGEVPAGIIGETGTVRFIDQPSSIHLDGAAGPVDLLAAVRTRTVGGSRSNVEVTENRMQFLVPRSLTLRPAVAEGSTPNLGPLTDADDATSADWPAGAPASLALGADAPFRLLELRWGCATGESETAVSLTTGDAAAYVLGTPVPPEGPVLAVGRQHQAGDHTFKALLALRVATTTATLEFGPLESDRCLREVIAYGFR